MSSTEQNPSLVSVVTPTFNQANFLRETIESVLSQDYPAIEHQIIDDGSTDATPEILREYSDRVWIERHENRGQTPTINKGWERAKGSILTWLNSDDTFLPGAVSRGVAYHDEHPDVGIVFGDTLFTDQDSNPLERSKNLGDFDYRRFVRLCHNPIPQPSAFIRRSVIEDIGMLDPSYYYFMDWDFWLRAGVNHRISYIPELLSTYRLHADSKTVAQANKAAPELEYMYRKFFARTDLPDSIRSLEKEAMLNMLFTSGGYYLEGGNKKAAAQTALKALRSFPSSFYQPSAVHKLFYCLCGGSSIYQRSRATYNRMRTIS
ncbi:MAG: glycosyltransferase [Acidobacteria bacterium]|nr:MAG: glycosyltransferase [Acidobacteriota bacterium]